MAQCSMLILLTPERDVSCQHILPVKACNDKSLPEDAGGVCFFEDYMATTTWRFEIWMLGMCKPQNSALQSHNLIVLYLLACSCN